MNAVDQVFVNIATWIHDALVRAGLPAFLATLVEMLLPAVAVVVVFPLFFAFLTWLERKLLGRMQNRYGPNRVGPFGLLQPIADGVKMLTKEDIVPRAADRLMHGVAPVVVVVAAIMLFAVLPFGKGMVAADFNVGVMFFFAVSSTTTIALFMAGWGSRNKYSIIGAMRAIAQMISYELPVVMNAVPVIMIAGSLRAADIITAQSGDETDVFFGTFSHWFVWKPWGLVGFVAFFIAGMAELNRSPFDLAEGESEIIAGFHTEYSGFKFALFFLGEYLGAIAFSGLAATLFLGGWSGPSFIPSWLCFFGKMFFLLCLMIWARGTFPRMRVDQLMGFSWKFLLPLAMVNIVAAGVWFHLPHATSWDEVIAWVVGAAILVPAYVGLSRLNAGEAAPKRNYKYADL